MHNRAQSVARIPTPLRAWAQRLGVTFLLLCAFGLTIVSRSDQGTIQQARIALTDAVAPILAAISSPITTVEDAVNAVSELSHLRAENAALRADNARLAGWYQQAETLKAENLVLRRMLNVPDQTEYRYVTAQVIADVRGPFLHSVVIQAGQADGAVIGLPALGEQGLAGRVAQVGERASRVLLITDINSRIPVLVGDGRERAILAGDNSPFPRLVFGSQDIEFMPGDRIVTSGHGGLFPRGLSIGTVESLDDKGARVRPSVDWAHMEYLRLLQSQLPSFEQLGGAADVSPMVGDRLTLSAAAPR